MPGGFSTSSAGRRDPVALRIALTAIAIIYLCIFIGFPLLTVLVQALSKGVDAYIKAIEDPEAIAAIKLTITVAAIAVPLNMIFGICAAWCIAKFDFVGKSLLITLIDLPFSVSPVVSGLVYVLLFGMQGWLGPFLNSMGIQVIFTTAALVLATIFVTFPFVARELIPLMQNQGQDEEEAAIQLGANGWHTLCVVKMVFLGLCVL
jgi:sulfate transport system permease protein